MNPLIQGLQISLLGILITFLALGIFIGLMRLLVFLFPEKETEPWNAMETAAPAGMDEERAAAIAAVYYLREQKVSPGLGKALEAGKGSWWRAGMRRVPQRRGGKR